MKIAGIDPGKKGAVCIMESTGDESMLMKLSPCPMIQVKKKNEYDINAMRGLLDGVARVYIEKVHAMPGQGTVSMFSFGKGYGIWLGLIAGLWIPVIEVAPQTWKKVLLRDMPKGKGSAILKAKQLFPMETFLATERSRKPSEGLAEACLIAFYGVKTECGTA